PCGRPCGTPEALPPSRGWLREESSARASRPLREVDLGDATSAAKLAARDNAALDGRARWRLEGPKDGGRLPWKVQKILQPSRVRADLVEHALRDRVGARGDSARVLHG